MAAPAIVHDVLRSPGQPLDAPTRAFMEPRFGHDFSRVKVHADDRAGESARAVHAHAYTQGEHIVFARGLYTPSTTEGLRLVGHELAHVVQQSAGRVPAPTVAGGGAAVVTSDSLEKEADEAGEQAARREPASVLGTVLAGAGVQRSAQHGPIQLDASSEDFKQGYQDGLSGGPPYVGPRGEDAATDYNEGYAKGHYELTQRSPSAAASPDQASLAAPPVAAAGMMTPLPFGPIQPPPGPIPPSAYNFPEIPGETPFQNPLAAAEGAEVTAGEVGAAEVGAGAAEVGAGAAEVGVGAAEVGALGTEAAAAGGTLLGIPVVGWILIGVAVVAVVAYVGYHYATSEEGKPTRPLTPDEEAQLQANKGKPIPSSASPATPGEVSSTPSVNPETGEPITSQEEADAVNQQIEMGEVGQEASKRKRRERTPQIGGQVDQTGEEVEGDPCDSSPLYTCEALGYAARSFAEVDAQIRAAYPGATTRGTEPSRNADCFKDGSSRGPKDALANGATHTTYYDVRGEKIGSLVCCKCCQKVLGESIPSFPQHCTVV